MFDPLHVPLKVSIVVPQTLYVATFKLLGGYQVVLQALAGKILDTSVKCSIVVVCGLYGLETALLAGCLPNHRR